MSDFKYEIKKTYDSHGKKVYEGIVKVDMNVDRVWYMNTVAIRTILTVGILLGFTAFGAFAAGYNWYKRGVTEAIVRARNQGAQELINSFTNEPVQLINGNGSARYAIHLNEGQWQIHDLAEKLEVEGTADAGE